MNECLLCEQSIAATLSWQALLGLDKQANICQDCSKKFQRADNINRCDNVDQLTSLYTYNEAMSDYLHQFKFLQDVQLACVFAGELREHLTGNGTIIPIPMHPEKVVQRTFAHVDELLKSARVPYKHLLEKTGIEVMGEKTKTQRLAMQPLFIVKPEIVIQPKTYILVDDIYTTGTTIRHAATVLKQAGAKRIEVVTLISAER